MPPQQINSSVFKRLLLLVSALLCFSSNQAFHPTHQTITRKFEYDGLSPNLAIDSFSSSTTRLMAVKKGNNKKKTKKSTAANSGGGFGASPASSQPQVRAVTGHTGSGTKPLRQAANTFDALRKEHGIEACRDVYVRAPLNDEKTFWFVGKIAINTDMPEVTPEMAIWSQKRLILEYAKHQLRPQNLGGKFAANQELWLAPGDSEMEVVQNKIGLTKVEGSASNLPDGFTVKNTVGFNPEIYVGDEVQKGGLRVQRDPETGDPINPVFEVNQSV